MKPDPVPKHANYRCLSEFIVWTTLPHYVAALFVCCPGDQLRIVYTVVIVVATTFSCVWHVLREPNGWVMYIDYTCATVWATMDMLVAIVYACPVVLVLVLVLNTLTLASNKITDAMARATIVDYATVHGWWHLLSVVKALCVSYLLGCYFNDRTCPRAVQPLG